MLSLGHAIPHRGPLPASGRSAERGTTRLLNQKPMPGLREYLTLFLRVCPVHALLVQQEARSPLAPAHVGLAQKGCRPRALPPALAMGFSHGAAPGASSTWGRSETTAPFIFSSSGGLFLWLYVGEQSGDLPRGLQFARGGCGSREGDLGAQLRGQKLPPPGQGSACWCSDPRWLC